MKERIVCYDLARTVAMLWVIGLWHSGIVEKNNMTTLATFGFLAIFTYISGLFLGGKTQSFNADEWMKYYKNRFLRIYPMFFVSCITLYLIKNPEGGHKYFSDAKGLAQALSGVAAFVGNMPATLWFVCMLIIFYILTPFMQMSSSKKINICIGVIIETAFIFIYILFKQMDTRMLLYFPFFAWGLYSGTKEEHFDWKKLVFGILSCMLYYNSYIDHKNNLLLQFLLSLFISIIVIEVLKLISGHLTVRIKRCVEIIAYASMIAYLFHRQLYYILSKVCTAMGISFKIILVLMLPAFLFACYYVQYWYDKLVSKIK